MYKVIIVDDEMLIRKRIIYGFEWEKLGYVIEDEAEDGETALELLEKKEYDLAIIDIAMPGLNGIDLVRLLRERQNRVHVIFLTGHSDFKYAQQAVQYGVYYYILKPVNEEEFIDVLKKLKTEIDQENAQKGQLEELMGKQDHMDVVIRMKLFSDYLRGKGREDSEERIRGIIERAGIRQEEGYRMVLFQVDAFLERGTSLSECVQILQNACQEVFGKNGACLVTCDMDGSYMLVLCSAKYYSGKEGEKEQIGRILHHLKDLAGGYVGCGISLDHKRISQMGEAYAESFSALNNAKMKKAEYLDYDMVREHPGAVYRIPGQELKELKASLIKNDFYGCSVIVKQVFEEMKRQQASFECVARNAERIVLELMDCGMISEQKLRKYLNGYANVEMILGNLSDLSEMAEWCEYLLYSVIEKEVRILQEGKSVSIVEKACEYIQEYYHDDGLSLSQIAEAMAVTSQYLSGIFKKTMGITMVQYLTMVRMEKAREMLLSLPVDVREISERVGYHDEYYFSRCFKKQYGVSPVQIQKLSKSRRIQEERLKMQE